MQSTRKEYMTTHIKKPNIDPDKESSRTPLIRKQTEHPTPVHSREDNQNPVVETEKQKEIHSSREEDGAGGGGWRVCRKRPVQGSLRKTNLDKRNGTLTHLTTLRRRRGGLNWGQRRAAQLRRDGGGPDLRRKVVARPGAGTAVAIGPITTLPSRGVTPRGGIVAVVRGPIPPRGRGAGARGVPRPVGMVWRERVTVRGPGATLERGRAPRGGAVPPAAIVIVVVGRPAVERWGRGARALATIVIARPVPVVEAVAVPIAVADAVAVVHGVEAGARVGVGRGAAVVVGGMPGRGAGARRRAPAAVAEAPGAVRRGARAGAAAGVPRAARAVPGAGAVRAGAVAADAVAVAVPLALPVAAVRALDGAARVRVVALDVEAAHVVRGLAVARRPHDVDDAVVAEDVGAVQLGAGRVRVRLALELDVGEAADFFGEVVLG